MYGNTTLVRSVVKTRGNGLEATGCLTELAVFIGILVTTMTKSAVHVETVMFIVYLMKNSSMCHKNCEKISELHSLQKVIVRRKIF